MTKRVDDPLVADDLLGCGLPGGDGDHPQITKRVNDLLWIGL